MIIKIISYFFYFGLEGVLAPKGWGPEGEGEGPEGGCPKFCAFFCLPPHCFFFLPSLGGLRRILVVF